MRNYDFNYLVEKASVLNEMAKKNHFYEILRDDFPQLDNFKEKVYIPAYKTIYNSKMPESYASNYTTRYFLMILWDLEFFAQTQKAINSYIKNDADTFISASGLQSPSPQGQAIFCLWHYVANNPDVVENKMDKLTDPDLIQKYIGEQLRKIEFKKLGRGTEYTERDIFDDNYKTEKVPEKANDYSKSKFSKEGQSDLAGSTLDAGGELARGVGSEDTGDGRNMVALGFSDIEQYNQFKKISFKALPMVRKLNTLYNKLKTKDVVGMQDKMKSEESDFGLWESFDGAMDEISKNLEYFKMETRIAALKYSIKQLEGRRVTEEEEKKREGLEKELNGLKSSFKKYDTNIVYGQIERLKVDDILNLALSYAKKYPNGITPEDLDKILDHIRGIVPDLADVIESLVGDTENIDVKHSETDIDETMDDLELESDPESGVYPYVAAGVDWLIANGKISEKEIKFLFKYWFRTTDQQIGVAAYKNSYADRYENLKKERKEERRDNRDMKVGEVINYKKGKSSHKIKDEIDKLEDYIESREGKKLPKEEKENLVNAKLKLRNLKGLFHNLEKAADKKMNLGESVMGYMTEQVYKDSFKPERGVFVERGFKKPINYSHWLSLNGQ